MYVVDLIVELFNERGSGLYFGEQVTEREHALQCAHLAEQAGASRFLVAGALLHDVGHLLHDEGEDVADRGVDAKHEDLGAHWLGQVFPKEVVDCVRLHVDAKRYLCAVDSQYEAGLSPASRESLRLQGGPFTPEEVAAFERDEPNFRSAVQVRRWDDQAKVVGLATPPVEHYRPLLERMIV